MSCILNIETSTDVCSVAISDSGQVWLKITCPCLLYTSDAADEMRTV